VVAVNAATKLPNAAPANDPPRYQTFEKVAADCGFKNTRAVRNWCQKRGVPYHRDGGFNWVDRNAVEAAITRGPVHVIKAVPPPTSIDAWVGATLGGKRG
jgi:hypothetical protein